MSMLLDKPAYGARDEELFIAEMNALTRHHLAGCPFYRRIWSAWTTAACAEDLPYLHVGIFKRLALSTTSEGIRHERFLTSSATTLGVSSRIALDASSSQLQSRSTKAILEEFIGPAKRPLLVLDSAKSLLARGEISARIAAAMSLRPMASDIVFLLDEIDRPESMNWARLLCALKQHSDILVYGFTWMLWRAWAKGDMPDEVRIALREKRIHFVHSGGWKKLETLKVSRAEFDGKLLQGLHSESRVLDYYGLVEQVGVIYPLCEQGSRHVPVWADVLVRDPFTLDVLPVGEIGMLQLMNTLAWGAPYHSVLTEDLGRILPGTCACGRSGHRFELAGRIPKAEVRGCANV